MNFSNICTVWLSRLILLVLLAEEIKIDLLQKYFYSFKRGLFNESINCRTSIEVNIARKVEIVRLNSPKKALL